MSGEKSPDDPNKASHETLSRRGFIVYGGAACIATIAATIVGDAPELDIAIDSTPVIYRPPITPDVGKLSILRWVEIMREPGLFTELQGENTKKIITCQFDENEYKRLKRKASRINSCGQSTLATIVKLCGFLNTRKVPDITIADVDNALDGKTFRDAVDAIDYPIITQNDSMYFAGLADSLKILVPQLISKTEILTTNYGTKHTRVVPLSHWPDILSKAQAVCEGGGCAIIGCLKHGGGHIVLGLDIKKDGMATIVDSYSGTVQRVFLENYFEWQVDPEAEFLGKQPWLLSMIGVTPYVSS